MTAPILHDTLAPLAVALTPHIDEARWLALAPRAWRAVPRARGRAVARRAGLLARLVALRPARPDALLADNVKITLAFGKLLERYDVLLLPVVPYATPLANSTLSPAVAHDFEAFLQGFLDAGRYTIPANEAGLPALALPAVHVRHGG